MKVYRIPPKPTFRWRVPSKSNKGTFHVVSWHKKTGYKCDCIAGIRGHQCRHIRIALNHFKGVKYEKEY